MNGEPFMTQLSRFQGSLFGTVGPGDLNIEILRFVGDLRSA